MIEMDCKITLSNGDAGVFTSDGTCEITQNGFVLVYTLDGDGCVLTYDGSSLKQKRRGETPMTLVFKENAVTECTLGGAGLIGSFAVYTRRLKAVCGDGGASVSLLYECAGETVSLEITADKK